MRILVILVALALTSCEGGLFTPKCEEIGVYPGCRRVGSIWTCETGTFVCNDLSAQYTCKDNGGVLCRLN